MTRLPIRYRLTLALEGIAPPIWRRLVVPPAITLRRFHHIVQIAMGWANWHPYRFQQDGREFGQMDPSIYLEDDLRFTLKYLLMKPGDSLGYEYDFQDSWRHIVLLEEVVIGNAALPQTRCIDGARACPPEDCGGVQGYQSLLEAIHDPFHAKYRETWAWVGTDFDSEAFDVAAVNRALASRGQRRHLQDVRRLSEN
jgi:pRiA4b ORF-3-like protein